MRHKKPGEYNPLDDIDATLNIKSVWRDGIQAKEFQKQV